MPPLPVEHPNHGKTFSRANSEPDRNEVNSAPFYSILFDDRESSVQFELQPIPDCFRDLNLDQIVDTITAGRDDYNLKAFFYAPLTRVEAVNYRQEIFRDLENSDMLQPVLSFAEEMRRMRAHLALSEKRYYKRQRQVAFLDAAETYCSAVVSLTQNLIAIGPNSRGLQQFRSFLVQYSGSEDFKLLKEETEKIRTVLATVRYSLHIRQGRVTVDRDQGSRDYSLEVLETFEKFRQADLRSLRLRMPSSNEMNHIEARILELVAKLHSDIFTHLEEFCGQFRNYCHEVIAVFDREIQFYLSVLQQLEQVRKAGLAFCYPELSSLSKEVEALETFDFALANRLVRARRDVVTNSFYLRGPERIFVVSGPNQGGKTTFARTFGQLHYLAALGCPVPGKSAKLLLFDHIFTHFEKEENVQNLRGKLEDELVRINETLETATARSIVIMNESFLSTTLNDALFLSREVMKQIADLNLLCVSVTFLDELASFNEATVSMVSTVDPKDPQERTFKVVRKPADGLAYAIAIAEKYQLTYHAVKARLDAKQGEMRRP